MLSVVPGSLSGCSELNIHDVFGPCSQLLPISPVHTWVEKKRNLTGKARFEQASFTSHLPFWPWLFSVRYEMMLRLDGIWDSFLSKISSIKTKWGTCAQEKLLILLRALAFYFETISLNLKHLTIHSHTGCPTPSWLHSGPR